MLQNNNYDDTFAGKQDEAKFNQLNLGGTLDTYTEKINELVSIYQNIGNLDFYFNGSTQINKNSINKNSKFLMICIYNVKKNLKSLNSNLAQNELNETIKDIFSNTISRILDNKTIWNKSKFPDFKEFFLAILLSETKNFISNNRVSKKYLNYNDGKRSQRYDRLYYINEDGEELLHSEVEKNYLYNNTEKYIHLKIDFDLAKHNFIKYLEKTGKPKNYIELALQVYELKFEKGFERDNKSIAQQLNISISEVVNIHKVILRFFKKQKHLQNY